ncbi:unnamed protein product [Alopecurus aequalis]
MRRAAGDKLNANKPRSNSVRAASGRCQRGTHPTLAPLRFIPLPSSAPDPIAAPTKPSALTNRAHGGKARPRGRAEATAIPPKSPSDHGRRV